MFRLDAELPSGAERRCHEVATRMVESGDWLVPRFRDHVRFQKPPLCYWAAASVMSLTGDRGHAAARLPAVLAALGLVVLVFVWGREIASETAGLVAAFLLTAMSQFWVYARSGVADMPLAFCAIGALVAFDRAYWAGSRRAVPLFFGLVWLGFLAKATVALLLVGLPIALRLSLDRTWRRVWRPDVVGWAVACGLASLAWFGAMLWVEPSAWEEFRSVALNPLGMAAEGSGKSHVRPVWYHAPRLLAAALPAVLASCLVVSRSEAAEPRPTRMRFPAMAFVALFVAFSLIPMKQRHYMLPLLPMLAVALAPAVARALTERRPGIERACRVAGLTVLAVAPLWLGFIGLHAWSAAEPFFAALALGAVILGATGVAAAPARSRSLRSFLLASWLLAWSGIAFVQIGLTPWIKAFRDEVTEEQPRYDPGRWSRLFAWQPALRAIYQAEDWGPDQNTRAENPGPGP